MPAATDPEAMAQVFATGAAAARTAGLVRFSGWLPPELLPHLAWRVRTIARRRAIPMLRSLRDDDLSDVTGPGSYIPFQDQF